MVQQEWDAMTKSEQAEYLQNAERKVKSKQFIDGSKKVGDYSAFSKKFMCLIGGINMSGWCESEKKANELADKNMQAFV